MNRSSRYSRPVSRLASGPSGCRRPRCGGIPPGLPRDTARSTWWTAEQELELGQPWLAISVADSAWWQASSYLPEEGLPVSLQRALYPLPFESTVCRAAERHDLPWSLLAGVAREESRWNPNVVSKVGARGLMQLMPATAIATGAANGRPEIEPDDLFEPLISLDLGAAELGRSARGSSSGNRAAAVAAYNAGEAQAQLWLDQCGQAVFGGAIPGPRELLGDPRLHRGGRWARRRSMTSSTGRFAITRSANEASDLAFFERSRDPAFDLVVELAFGDELAELVLDRGQRWRDLRPGTRDRRRALR